jgi:hypothetical protein
MEMILTIYLTDTYQQHGLRHTVCDKVKTNKKYTTLGNNGTNCMTLTA